VGAWFAAAGGGGVEPCEDPLVLLLDPPPPPHAANSAAHATAGRKVRTQWVQARAGIRLVIVVTPPSRRDQAARSEALRPHLAVGLPLNTKNVAKE
jgi:hypothetical protein